MVQIAVRHPRFWWRATTSDLRRWVPNDPDEGRPSIWPDHLHQRWDLIAQVVRDVGESLAKQSWDLDSEFPGMGYVDVDVPALTRTERKIAQSWFTGGEPVRIDPWFDLPTGGRHRIWSTFPHLGGAMVPIKSAALELVNPEDAIELGPRWRDVYATDLNTITGYAWFDQADPVNTTFLDALRTAASGKFPDPA